MAKAYWEVEGVLVGISEVAGVWIREQYCESPPWNYACFCPVCGEVWARVWTASNNPWFALNSACRKHYWSVLHTPGTLLDGWLDEHYGATAPLAILRREFMIESNEFDPQTKEPSNAETT